MHLDIPLIIISTMNNIKFPTRFAFTVIQASSDNHNHSQGSLKSGFNLILHIFRSSSSSLGSASISMLPCHPPWWQSYLDDKLSCQPWWRQPPVSSLKFGGDLILHVLTHPSPDLQILTNAKNIREGRLWKRCGSTTFVMDCKRKGVEMQVSTTRSQHHNN